MQKLSRIKIDAIGAYLAIVAILAILVALMTGCQTVKYIVEISGDDNHLEIPGNAEVAKPIEVSPARNVEARDNKAEGIPGI